MPKAAGTVGWSTRRVWREADVPDHLARALVEYKWLLWPPTGEADVVPLKVAAALVFAPVGVSSSMLKPRQVQPPRPRDEKAMRLATAVGQRGEVPIATTLAVWPDDAALLESAEEVAAAVVATRHLMGVQILLPVGVWAADLPSRRQEDPFPTLLG